MINLSNLRNSLPQRGQGGKTITHIGQDGREVEIQSDATYIQWRHVGSKKWINLIAIKDLEGEVGPKGVPGIQGLKGDPGIPGQKGNTGDTGSRGLPGTTGEPGIDGKAGKDGDNGKDGREIELRIYAGYIQWHYIGDVSWKNLISLDELRGPKGDEGSEGKKGERGPKGDKGDMGIIGYTGPKGPKGDPGTTEALILNEIPTGAVDGVNTTFTTANPFVPDSSAIYINGLRQKLNVCYTESGLSEITIPDAVYSGDILTVDYIKA